MSSPADTPLPCPACGYDLRPAPSDRCSECGLEIDRESLKVSGVPWAHRRRIGRVRAFFRTFWQLTVRAGRLRYEFSRPQEMKDARSFRRIIAITLAVALVCGFITAWMVEGDLEFLAFQQESPFQRAMAGRNQEDHWHDAAVPWSAGATIVPVLPICFVMLAWWLSGAQRFILRLSDGDAGQQRSALAMMHYTSAPLVLALPGTVWLCAFATFIDRELERGVEGLMATPFGTGITIINLLAVLLILFAPLMTLIRSAQFVCRGIHAGLLRGFAAAGELLLLWLLGVVFFLGLVPWFVGFVWIVIDSFR